MTDHPPDGGYDASRTELADPNLPLARVIEICNQFPDLRPLVAAHPSADAGLLAWLADQPDDPLAAATARHRLASPPAPALPEEAPSGSSTRRRSIVKPALFVGGVAAIVIAAFVVVLVLQRGQNGAYNYAPDFPGSKAPGLTATNLASGLSGDKTNWSTSLVDTGVGTLVALDDNTAVFTYRSAVTARQSALAAQRAFDAGYPTGYQSGKNCLTSPDALNSWSGAATYCQYDVPTIVSTGGDGAQAGYNDAVNALPSNVQGAAARPQVPPAPVKPADGPTLRGLDLKTARVTWSLSAWSVQSDADVVGLTSDTEGLVVALLRAPASSDATSSVSTETLVAIDAATGQVKSTVPTTSKRVAGFYAAAHGVIAVYDQDGRLSGLSATDLSKQVWTSPAHYPAVEGGMYQGSPLNGEWVLTDNGYLDLRNGTPATFAVDAGRHGIYLQDLPGTKDGVLRIESSATGTRVTGFDITKNSETWQAPKGATQVHSAGNLLIMFVDGGVEAYKVHGNNLVLTWRNSDIDCGQSGCSLAFVGPDHVVVESTASTEASKWVLRTSDGTETGTIQGTGSLLTGKSVMYNVDSDGLTAYDLSKDGVPAIWRVNGNFTVSLLSGKLVVRQGTLAGVMGGQGDDWSQFAGS